MNTNDVAATLGREGVKAISSGTLCGSARKFALNDGFALVYCHGRHVRVMCVDIESVSSALERIGIDAKSIGKISLQLAK